MILIKGVIAIAGAYLIGSVPAGYWFSAVVFKKDIRKLGSGNIGATNIYRVLGPVAGMTVFFVDYLKGVIPVLLFTILMKDMPTLTFQSFQVAVALAAMLGHIYSVFLNFSGGKGVATTAGVLTVLSWEITIILFIIWVFVILISRYISLASITIAIALPILAIIIETDNPPFLVFGVVGAALVIYKHRENITRIANKEEPKVWERR